MIKALIAVLILAVIFGGIALVIGMFFWGIKMLRGPGGRKADKYIDEEARMIQEMYQGLTKMESRVETLETILLDQKSKEKEK